MKRFMLVIIKILIKPVDVLISFIRTSHLNIIFLLLCKALESKTEYAAYQIRPKDTTEIPILSSLNQPYSLAIILQGPICTKDNMTINTVKYYKKVYPFAQIILSTWNDESKKDIERIKAVGAIVVQDEKPLNSGFWNVNYQLVSSLNGARRAKELGCEFSVKTRTDQRVCKPYVFDSMVSAVKLFPGGNGQKGRIVTLGYTFGGMFTPYMTCDFLYLGYTDDIINVFSSPLDIRADDFKLHHAIGQLSRRQNSKEMFPPEIYILKHYCKNVLGLKGMDTVEEHWNIAKNYLVCYGAKDVCLMWQKYDRIYDLNFYSSTYYGDKDSPKRLSTMCFDFLNWFNLYTGNSQYDKSYERYADVKLMVENGKNGKEKNT